MSEEYSVDLVKELIKKHQHLELLRPTRVDRYECGDILEYYVRPVMSHHTESHITLTVDKFIGGGFAGQVYRVMIQSIEGPTVPGLCVGGMYAMKILIPPTGFSLMFRNIIYAMGFQGPFQLQTNPEAARSGALWQKFIRRGAALCFHDEKAVNDIHATFVDRTLGSCGELSDWVEGRTWRLEVNDRMDMLAQWKRGKAVDLSRVGSPEFRAKKEFMRDFVGLLHDMGAHEFARQYEWSTCKSQPNCLKRIETKKDPSKGLVAVDFRAGLALLPFLPMSPGDFVLIVKGLLRGSVVQFDRGDIKKLESFIDAHRKDFEDLVELLPDLKAAEEEYRNSVPDITHNHVRLLYSAKLYSTMLKNAVVGWHVRNLIDEKKKEKMCGRPLAIMIFLLAGCIPIFGRIFRKFLGHDKWRAHYLKMISSVGYLKKAVKGRMIESVIRWVRDGRIKEEKAVILSSSFMSFCVQLPFSILPACLHRFFTDRERFKDRLYWYFVRPVRLYFNSDLREQWLRDMVKEGVSKHIITDEDATEIVSQIKEPFIQKYLKSLAVHVCTLPVTQIVSITVAMIYVIMHPELTKTQQTAAVGIILGIFQVIPISPGSICRGLYVLALVIKERNFKDYNIAVFLGFFKYVGYLSFPIQMAYRYPTIARFMASHWATEAVHIIPVFGESGALLEHGIFSLFYNHPLTVRRKLGERAERRKRIKSRYYMAVLVSVACAAAFIGIDKYYIVNYSIIPNLKQIWWLLTLIPFIGGIMISRMAGGASSMKRVLSAVVASVAASLMYTAFFATYGLPMKGRIASIFSTGVWRMFIFSLISALGVLLSEITAEN
ncbi:MAG: hypothetical protein ACMUJM_21220 [bacterium]